MTAMRLPAAGGLWRTQSYHPWMEPRSGGMLASLKVGLSEGGDERLSRSYAYNSFGDITALTEGTTSYTFNYDGLGRLTEAYGRTYSYDAANRLTSFNGQVYNYYDSGPYHAVDRIGDFDRFDYDANGNMVEAQQGAERASRRLCGTLRTGCRRCRTTTATWSSSTGTAWTGCASRRRAAAPRPTPSSRNMRRRSPTV